MLALVLIYQTSSNVSLSLPIIIIIIIIVQSSTLELYKSI